MSPGVALGDRLVVDVGRVAHGGHCVARHAGQVLFVRHALPGETVEVRVTGIGRKARFVRADVEDVLVASPDRRAAPCPVAATCGGCDWQHVTPGAARRLKADVVREAMTRLAGIVLPDLFEVEPLADSDDGEGSGPLEGLGWRTRGTLGVDDAGRAGFRAHRSHRVVAAGQCLQLDPRLAPLDLLTRTWPPGRLGFVAPGEGPPRSFPESAPPADPITERAAGRTWSVAADGFWQVHPRAADALVAHVLRMLGPRPRERLVDLYAGVGLFGLSAQGAVAGRTGGAAEGGAAGGEVGLDLVLVEGDRRACELARVNAGGRPARIVRADVARWIARPGVLRGTDLVVLDPPRTGAGAAVVAAIAAARPRVVAYVACDPVALARDLATFRAHGMELRQLVALDLFPTTQHVECLARLTPG